VDIKNIKIGIVTILVASNLAQATPSLASVSAHTMNATSLTHTIESMELMQDVSYIYINPYFRSDGTYVRGHYRTTRDGYCWNNLSGC